MRVLSAMRIPAPPHAADMPGRRALADMRRTGALRHAECIASHKVQQRPAVFCAMSGAPRSSASRAISSAPRSSALHTISNAPRSSAPRAMQHTARICALRHGKCTALICSAHRVQRTTLIYAAFHVKRTALVCATRHVQRTAFICTTRHVKHRACAQINAPCSSAPAPCQRTALCAPDQEYRVYLHHTHTTCIGRAHA